MPADEVRGREGVSHGLESPVHGLISHTFRYVARPAFNRIESDDPDGLLYSPRRRF